MRWAHAACSRSVLSLGLVGLVVLSAGAKRPAKPPAPGEFNPAHETVDLFSAIDAGQIEARLIPRSSEQARVFLTNKTGRPLNVRLPEAIAGVPALAQFGAQGGGNPFGQGQGAQGAGGGGGGAQSVGGGMNGGGGNGQNQGANNFFNVAPERVGELKIPCVCLEHGKKEPRAAIPYRLVPIESVTTDPIVPQLLAGLADEQYSQRVAQAAAWHLANGMTWEQLAAKREMRLVGASPRFFSAKEIAQAKSLVEKARAAQAEETPSEASLSQR